jgi:hypothetical protein
MLPVIHRGHDQHGFFVQGMSFSRTPRLRQLAGNRPAPGDRYVCVFTLRNYNSLDRKVAGFFGVAHYSEALEPAVLADIRAGRAVLVLDLSNEGPAYHSPHFEPLYNWIEAERLPPGSVIWLCQNRAMPSRAQASAGRRAALLRFEHYDYFPKWMAWRFATSPPLPPCKAPASAAPPSRLLLCLNATPRLQRVLTVAALLHAGLIEESLVSFPGMVYAKQGTSADQVRRFVATHTALAYLREPVERAIALQGLRVDDFAEEGNQLADKIDPAPYAASFFSLVTESDLSDGRILRITEKTVKAFALGHPALVVGNPHSIRCLTDLGFQDWDGLIDRAHEAIDDPAERFQAVMYETRRQVGLIRDDPAAWLAAAGEVSRFNRRHAESGALLARMEATQDEPLVRLLSGMVGLS